jgi:hypothetical protein
MSNAFWQVWLGQSANSNPAGSGADASINSNVLKQSYINRFLDVSGTLTVRYDASINGNLYLGAGSKFGLGIGTPAYTLDMSGTHRIQCPVAGVVTTKPDANPGNNGLVLTSTKASGGTNFSMGLGIDYTTGNGYLNMGYNSGTSATQPFVLQATGGDVGIGSANPTAALYVVGNQNITGTITGAGGSGNNAGAFYTGGNTVASFVNAVTINSGVTNAAVVEIGSLNRDILSSAVANVTYKYALAYHTNTTGGDFEIKAITSGASYNLDGTPVSRMYITASGNIGMGTVRPQYNLDVSGTGRFTSDVSINGNLVVGNLVVGGALTVQQMQSKNVINTTTTNYQLIVSEDLSLNGRLFVPGLNTAVQKYWNLISIIGNNAKDLSANSFILLARWGAPNTATGGVIRVNGTAGWVSEPGKAAFDFYVTTRDPTTGTKANGNLRSDVLVSALPVDFRLTSDANFSYLYMVIPASNYLYFDFTVSSSMNGYDDLMTPTVSTVLSTTGTTRISSIFSSLSNSIYQIGGSVGIGTTAPNSTLNVIGSNSSVNNRQITVGSNYDVSTVNDRLGALVFSNNNNNAEQARIESCCNVGGAGNNADLRFFTRLDYVTYNERMRIDRLGNVGIGTTAPASKLDVATSNPGFTVVGTAGNTGLPTTTVYGDYTVLTFTQTGAYTFTPAAAMKFGYIVVAGGGGGGCNTLNANTGANGGAGGATVYCTYANGQTMSASTAYTITVGGGGAGATTSPNNGAAGGNSSISGTGITTITAVGGQGGYNNTAAQTPASTGSAGNTVVVGGVGGNSSTTIGTNATGGNGTGFTLSDIAASTYVYGPGGGGVVQGNAYGGSGGGTTSPGGGGSHGGGFSAYGTLTNGTGGTAIPNTGGGGGGSAGVAGATGGRGGSGIVIIYFLTSKANILGSLTLNSGCLGIGMSNPAYSLDVNGSARFNTNQLIISNTYDTNTPLNETSNLTFVTNTGATNWQTASISSYILANAGTNGGYPGGLAFNTKSPNGSNTSLPTTRMVIDSNGNVGIGTTAPGYFLDVSAGTGTKIHSLYIHAQSNNGTMALGAAALQRAGTFANGFALYQGTGGDTVVNAASGQTIGFKINNAQVAFLNSTTLEVAGGINIQGSNVINFGSNTAGKEGNAGKIGYNAFNNNGCLDIVGGGTTTPRKVYIYDMLGVNAVPTNTLEVGGASILGTVYNNNTFMGTANGWGFFPSSANSGTIRYNPSLVGAGGNEVNAYFGAGTVNIMRFATGTVNGQYVFFTLGSQKIYLNDYASSGNLTVDSGGRLVAGSDRRIKNNIVYLTDTNNLEKIKQLKPCSYYLNDSDYPNKKIGFIAQDLETVIPDAVDGKKYEYMWKVDENNKPIFDADGNLIMTDKIRPRNIDNTAILAFLVKGTQELAAIVESQQTLISNLEARLSALENK